MKKARVLTLVLAVFALGTAVPMIARGGTGGATLDYTERIGDSGPIETSSTEWQLIEEVPIIDAVGGSVSVRFSGTGFAQDYGNGGVFKGEKYAALKVKVMFGAGNQGAVTFADNRGVIKSASPKPMMNTGEWGTGAGSDYTVGVYMKSLNENDLVGFKSWQITLNYGKEV